MHPKTTHIREQIGHAGSIEEKLRILAGAYKGETCYLLTCGPSFNENWNDDVKKLLSDKLIISVKQTYDEAKGMVDFHLLNSWNYQPYEYTEPRPVVLAERADDDPPTPGMEADLFFRIPDPRDFANRLATTYAFDKWLFTRQVDRPWGPGVVYELGIYLFVHLGVKEVITLGWDLGELNIPLMKHFFKEEAPDSPKADGLLNKPRIRPFEVQDIAESTRALYYWLRSKGIYLYIVSARSLVDPVAPRISIFDDRSKRSIYKTGFICNGHFTSWQADLPAYWETNGAAGLIARTAGTPDGSFAVELRPAGRKKDSSIYQLLKLEVFFQGGRLTGTAEALAHEPGKLCFSIACFKNNKDRDPVEFQANHPGDGQWHELKIDEIIPTHVPISHLKFQVKLRPGAKKPASVNRVLVRFEK